MLVFFKRWLIIKILVKICFHVNPLTAHYGVAKIASDAFFFSNIFLNLMKAAKIFFFTYMRILKAVNSDVCKIISFSTNFRSSG